MRITTMRKTTITMIIGIVIGMSITSVSNRYGLVQIQKNQTNSGVVPPMATKVNIVSDEVFKSEIAPGLQIIQVPPPLDINGLHPYQCYLNGQPVNIPREVIEGLLAKHTDVTETDPNFNVHDFTGNLKFVGARPRGVVGE